MYLAKEKRPHQGRNRLWIGILVYIPVQGQYRFKRFSLDQKHPTKLNFFSTFWTEPNENKNQSVLFGLVLLFLKPNESKWAKKKWAIFIKALIFFRQKLGCLVRSNYVVSDFSVWFCSSVLLVFLFLKLKPNRTKFLKKIYIWDYPAHSVSQFFQVSLLRIFWII